MGLNPAEVPSVCRVGKKRIGEEEKGEPEKERLPKAALLLIEVPMLRERMDEAEAEERRGLDGSVEV